MLIIKFIQIDWLSINLSRLERFDFGLNNIGSNSLPKRPISIMDNTNQSVYFYICSITHINSKKSSIMNEMEQECPICRTNFDLGINYPMVLCQQQHLYCSKCVQQLFLHCMNPNCPECRQPLKKDKINKFRYFEKFDKKVKEYEKNISLNNQEMKNKEQEQKQLRSFKEQCNNLALKCLEKKYSKAERAQKQIRDIIDDYHQVTGNYYRSFIKQKVEMLIAQYKYEKAIILLLETIEKYPTSMNQEDYDLGLGQREDNLHLNRDYQRYKKRYSNIDMTLQDVLVFCFVKFPNFANQREWYSKMMQKHPQNKKLQFGLDLTNQGIDYEDKLFDIYMNMLHQDAIQKKIQQIAAKASSFNKGSESVSEMSIIHSNQQQRNIRYKKISKNLISALINHPKDKNIRILLRDNIESSFQKEVKDIADFFIRQQIQQSSISKSFLFKQAYLYYQIESYQKSKTILLKFSENISFEFIQMSQQTWKLLGNIHLKLNQYQQAQRCFYKIQDQCEYRLYVGICNFIMKKHFPAAKCIKYSLQFFEKLKYSKELSTQMITALYKIVFYSSVQTMSYSTAKQYYKQWSLRVYNENQLNENSQALRYWSFICDANRPASMTDELKEKLELIMKYESSVSFYSKLITQDLDFYN